jgi:hypothetical protein
MCENRKNGLKYECSAPLPARKFEGFGARNVAPINNLLHHCGHFGTHEYKYGTFLGISDTYLHANPTCTAPVYHIYFPIGEKLNMYLTRPP